MANKKGSLKESTEEQAAIFGCLADPTRLKLVKLLCSQRYPDALCVNALAGMLGVTQSAISQHLRVLKSIGLVSGERRGYHIHYHLNEDSIEKYRQMVLGILSTEEPADKERCRDCNEGSRGNV